MRSKLHIPVKPLTLREAAAYLGIAPSTLRDRVISGAVEAEKDGKRWIFYPDVLADYRRARRYTSAHDAGNHRRNKHGQLTQQEVAILAKYGVDV